MYTYPPNYNVNQELMFQRIEDKVSEFEPLAQQFASLSTTISSPNVTQNDRMVALEKAENLAKQYEPLIVWRSVFRFISDQNTRSYCSKWLHFHLKKRWESLPHLNIFQVILSDAFDTCPTMARHTMNMVARLSSELYQKIFLFSNQKLLDFLAPFFQNIQTMEGICRILFVLCLFREIVTQMSGEMSSGFEETGNTVLNEGMTLSSESNAALKFRDIEMLPIIEKTFNIIVEISSQPFSPHLVDLILLSMEVISHCLNFDWTGSIGATDEELQTLQIPHSYRSCFEIIKTRILPFTLDLLDYIFHEEYTHMDRGGNRMANTVKILNFLAILSSWEGFFGSPPQIDSKAIFGFLSIIFHLLEKWSETSLPCFLHEEDFLLSFSKFLSRFALNCNLGHTFMVMPNEIKSIWNSVLKFINLLYRDSDEIETKTLHGPLSGHSHFRHCGRKLFFYSSSPQYILNFFSHVARSGDVVSNMTLKQLIGQSAADYLQNYLLYLSPDSLHHNPSEFKSWVEETLELDQSWNEEIRRTVIHLADLFKSDPSPVLQTFFSLLNQYMTEHNLIVEVKLTFILYLLSRLLELYLPSSLEEPFVVETLVLSLSYLIALSSFLFSKQQSLTGQYIFYEEQFVFLRTALLQFFIILCTHDRMQFHRPKDTENIDLNLSKYSMIYLRVSEYLVSTLGNQFSNRNRHNLHENMIKISMQIFELWSHDEYLMKENISFLQIFADSDWRNMDILSSTIMKHFETFLNPQRFPFLNPLHLLEFSDDELRAHKQLRRKFYQLIGRALFHSYKYSKNLNEKINHGSQIDQFFDQHFSFQQFELLNQDPLFKSSLIAQALNLRGIIESIDEESCYTLFFDWFFPSQLSIIIGLFFQWNRISGNANVCVSLLRLLIEIVDEKEFCRISFESNSPSSLLFFREICSFITRFGDYHLCPDNTVKYDSSELERQIYKPRGVVLKLMNTILDQNYFPFGVLYLSSSIRFFSMEHMISTVFGLVKAMKEMHRPEKFLMVYPKITRHYLRTLEVLCHNHSPIISALSIDDFEEMLNDLADGLSMGPPNSKTSSKAISSLCQEIIRNMHLCERNRPGWHEVSSDSLNLCRCAPCTVQHFSTLFQNENIVLVWSGLCQQLLDIVVMEVVRNEDLLILIKPLLPLVLLLPQVLTLDTLHSIAISSRRLNNSIDTDQLLFNFINFFDQYRQCPKSTWYLLTSDNSEQTEYNQMILNFRQQYFALKENNTISHIS